MFYASFLKATLQNVALCFTPKNHVDAAIMWNKTYILSELPSETETKEEVEFIWNVLNLKQGMIVLDLCCGQGRHTNGLSDLGCRIVGLDSSRYLLKEAKKLIPSKEVILIEGDMRQIPLESKVDAVINLFTSFGFFDELENQKVIDEISRVLKPDGKLLIDYWNPHTVSQLDGMRNWWWVDEAILALSEVKYDANLCTVNDYRTTVNLKTKEINKTVNHIRFYFPTELKRMLNKVGLEIIKMYGDFNGELFNLYSRRLITVAKKTEK